MDEAKGELQIWKKEVTDMKAIWKAWREFIIKYGPQVIKFWLREKLWGNAKALLFFCPIRLITLLSTPSRRAPYQSNRLSAISILKIISLLKNFFLLRKTFSHDFYNLILFKSFPSSIITLLFIKRFRVISQFRLLKVLPFLNDPTLFFDKTF